MPAVSLAPMTWPLPIGRAFVDNPDMPRWLDGLYRVREEKRRATNRGAAAVEAPAAMSASRVGELVGWLGNRRSVFEPWIPRFSARDATCPRPARTTPGAHHALRTLPSLRPSR